MSCLYSVSIPASMESGAQVVDFCFTDVAPGTYDLKILQINKLPFTVQGIPVTVGAEDLDLNTSSDALTNFDLFVVPSQSECFWFADAVSFCNRCSEFFDVLDSFNT